VLSDTFAYARAMTLLPGYPAPAFKLPGDDGRWWGLPDLRGQAAVLYFYPLAQVDPAWHAQAVLDTLRRWRDGQDGAVTLGA